MNVIKNVIKNMGVSFLTGLMFMMGIISAPIIMEYFEKRESIQYIPLPDGIKILEHKRVKNTHNFTVEGFLKNDSTTNINSVYLDMYIFADMAQMNECESNRVGPVKKGEKAIFKISCFGVSGQELPSNIRYELKIDEKVQVKGA